jgi:3-dehydroquinate dehydratase-2
MRILVLNGPNLNLLGQREPEIYGHETLDDIESLCQQRASELGIEISFEQSNSEGGMVDVLQTHGDWDGVILNGAAYTHTSLALADTLAAFDPPVVEVHLSNIYAREEIRHHSLTAPHTWGQISGFGYRGYLAALDLLNSKLSEEHTA